MSEQVADYVSCVRAQGAQLGAERGQRVSAEVGQLGVKAGGAAELNESLQKKYSASDQAMLAIIQACGAKASVEVATARSSAKLLAHWKFDEAAGNGVADASGNGNVGTIVGKPAWVTGKIGGALKFDGSQLIELDDSASQHSPHALTIAAWILVTKKDIGHPWRDISIKANPKGGNWWGCLNAGVPDANPCDEREFGMNINIDDRSLGVHGTTEDRFQNGGLVDCRTPGGTIEYDRWHHVVGVISSKSRTVRAIVDGSAMATCKLSEAGLRRTSGKLRIGTSFVGMLDDLRFYGGELTDAEIATLAAGR